MRAHVHRHARLPVRIRQGGFTYLGLIIFVFIIGMVGAATLKIGALLQRAQAEAELLEIGAQFSTALKTYAEATPRGQPTQPRTLQELLRDTRFPNPRRHLRKIFVDPVTGKAEWGLVTAGEGGRILGVHSLSKAQPLKLAKFDARFPGFENRQQLAQWKFMAEQQGVGAPGTPGMPSLQPMPAIGAPNSPIHSPATPAPPPPGAAPVIPPPSPEQPPPEPEPQPEPPREEPPPEEPPPEKPAEPEEAQPQAPPAESEDSRR